MTTFTRPWRLTLAALVAALAWATTPAVAQNITDADVTAAVTEELFDDVAISGYAIDVSTEDGVVTLDGTTNNLLAKRRAERIAEVVRGVEVVNNDVEVVAPMRSDAEIRGDVDDALLYNQATESFEITTSVDGQTVTLTSPRCALRSRYM